MGHILALVFTFFLSVFGDCQAGTKGSKFDLNQLHAVTQIAIHTHRVRYKGRQMRTPTVELQDLTATEPPDSHYWSAEASYAWDPHLGILRERPVIRFYYTQSSLQQIPLDVFVNVLCHEMGHHLGGIEQDPTRRPLISSEGEADYWAGQACIAPLLQRMGLSISKKKIRSFYFANRICTQLLASSRHASRYSRCIETALNAEKSENWLYHRAKQDGRAHGMEPTLEHLFLHPPAPPPTHLAPSKHPNPVCRVLTFILGSIQFQRPSCWNSKTESNF
jgi:hypothetical protein